MSGLSSTGQQSTLQDYSSLGFSIYQFPLFHRTLRVFRERENTDQRVDNSSDRKQASKNFFPVIFSDNLTHMLLTILQIISFSTEPQQKILTTMPVASIKTQDC